MIDIVEQQESKDPRRKRLPTMQRARDFVANLQGGHSPFEAYVKTFEIPAGDPRLRNARTLANRLMQTITVRKLIENSQKSIAAGALDPDLGTKHIENLNEVAFDKENKPSERTAASVAALRALGYFQKEDVKEQHITINLTDFSGNTQINAPAGGHVEPLPGERHFAIPLHSTSIPKAELGSPGVGSEAIGIGESPKVG
jgi:hypothetical protein